MTGWLIFLCVLVALLLIVEVVDLIVGMADRWYRGVSNLARTDPEMAEIHLAWRPWYVRAFDRVTQDVYP